MDRDLAKRIVKAVMDLNAPVGAFDSLSTEIADPDTARTFRYALGNLMAGTMDLLRPIVRQFPDLDHARDPD
jgi:hypothetical protein